MALGELAGMTIMPALPVDDVKQAVTQEVLTKLSPFRRRKAEGLAAGKPDVVTGLRAQGIEPKSSRPAEFAAFIAEQLDLHRKLVDEAGLKFEP